MRRSKFVIGDSIAEFLIQEGAWKGENVLKPLYTIDAITLGGKEEISVERTYKLTEPQREVMYGAQYEDSLLPHAVKESDYRLGDLPFSIRDGMIEKPLGV